MTTRAGGCRCGNIRYETSGDALHVTLCHCSDCRRSAGAPMVAWAGFMEAQFTLLQGAPRTHQSSEHAERAFCGDCGTGLVYRNQEVLPGLVDIQAVTFDDPEALPPVAHIQAIDQLGWMKTAHDLPAFERFPPQP